MSSASNMIPGIHPDGYKFLINVRNVVWNKVLNNELGTPLTDASVLAGAIAASVRYGMGRVDVDVAAREASRIMELEDMLQSYTKLVLENVATLLREPTTHPSSQQAALPGVAVAANANATLNAYGIPPAALPTTIAPIAHVPPATTTTTAMTDYYSLLGFPSATTAATATAPTAATATAYQPLHVQAPTAPVPDHCSNPHSTCDSPGGGSASSRSASPGASSQSSVTSVTAEGPGTGSSARLDVGSPGGSSSSARVLQLIAEAHKCVATQQSATAAAGATGAGSSAAGQAATTTATAATTNGGSSNPNEWQAVGGSHASRPARTHTPAAPAAATPADLARQVATMSTSAAIRAALQLNPTVPPTLWAQVARDPGLPRYIEAVRRDHGAEMFGGLVQELAVMVFHTDVRNPLAYLDRGVRRYYGDV